MLTLRIVFDLFKIIHLIYLHKYHFEIYNASIVAQIKSIKVLMLCCGSGDTKYPQKQGKFTILGVLFDLHGCFVYITMLQIFGNIVGNVSTIYRRLIKAEYLRLLGRHVWDTKIY